MPALDEDQGADSDFGIGEKPMTAMSRSFLARWMEPAMDKGSAG